MGKELSVPSEDMDYLLRRTTYTTGEVRYLYRRFGKLCGRKRISMKMKHLAYNIAFQENPVMEPLANVLFESYMQSLSFVDFAMFLHIFKAPDLHDTPQAVEQRTKEKIKLICQLYDLSQTGKVTRHDLYTILYRMYGDHLDNADLYRIIDIIIAEIGDYGADFLTFNEISNSLTALDVDGKLMIRFPQA